MSHPQPPEATIINKAITLEELAADIYDPAILTNLIAVYEPTLNTGSKFQTDSIVRILMLRMTVWVTTQAETGMLHQKCMAQVKTLNDDSLKMLADSKALLNAIVAADSGTDIHMHAQKSVADAEDVTQQIRLLLQHFMNDIFEESGADANSFRIKYDELNKLLLADSQQQSWALKTMQQDMVQLKEYATLLSLDPAKQATLTAYQPLLAFYTESFALNQLILRKKTVNPNITDAVVAAVQTFVQSAETLVKEYNSWINLLYKYDQVLETVRNQLACMGIIAGKADGEN